MYTCEIVIPNPQTLKFYFSQPSTNFFTLVKKLDQVWCPSGDKHDWREASSGWGLFCTKRAETRLVVNPRCQPLPAGAPRHGIHVALVSPQRAPNLGARLRVIKSDGVVFASINPTIPCGQYASIPEQFGLMMGVSSDNFEEVLVLLCIQ